MKKMILVCAALFCMSGCGSVVGEKMEYSKACDLSNEKKTIEVSGFLDAGSGLFCSNTSGRMECGLKLKPTADSEEKGFTADIATGSGANTMDEVKSGYKQSDIVVRSDDGKQIDLKKGVTITGLQSVAKGPGPESLVCFMKVYKIVQ